MKAAAFAVSLLALSAAGPVIAAPATDAAILAVALPEPQFRSLLARVIFSTDTMAMDSYALGIDATCAVVRPAFDAAIAKHLPAWQANLVAAYRANVPKAVLDQVAAAGPVAGARLVQPYADRIGEKMQVDSEPILKEAASEILVPLISAAVAVDPATIDGASRGKELSAALDKGTAQCGLSTANKRPA